MARIDTEGLSIVVARSLIAEGEVDLSLPAAKPIKLAVGQTLDLCHAYEFEEASILLESFTFSLAAETDGERHQKAEVTVRDRPLVTDDGKGSVRIPFRFKTAGRRVIRFTARTRYGVAGRSADARSREKEGRLTVDVTPSATK